MALVAYDNSDSSEYEEDNGTTPVITLKEKKEVPEKNTSKIIANEDYEVENAQNLFKCLPRPTYQKNIVEEDDEFLYKKENAAYIKPKSKITVPSLSDFKDVKETVPSIRAKVSKGKKSGLLSILPQPKNSSTSITTSKPLIPHVLTKKPQSSTTNKQEIHSPSRKLKVALKQTSNLISQYSDDSDNDDDGIQNDFFSIHKPVKEFPSVELPLHMAQPSSSKVRNTPTSTRRGIESYFKEEPADNHVEEVHNDFDSKVMYTAQGSRQFNDNIVPNESGGLDEEAILKLCGSRSKRKREDIQIVDVNQQEVLDGAREWLVKGLMDDTSKRVSASKKRGNEPTSQQKRKHQITYLAHQAKANEAELQNQWANNRMTKRQTQSKYGF